MWFDHSIVHETSESYQDAVMAHVEDIITSLAFMETTKKCRFAALIPLADHLLKNEVPDFQPFLFISSYVCTWVSERGRRQDDKVDERSNEQDIDFDPR